MYRHWYDGLGLALGIAATLAVLGVLALLLVVQTPSFVQWSGTHVDGTRRGTQVAYTYGGREYSVEDSRGDPDDARPKHVGVWLSRAHPRDSSSAYVANSAARWTDFSLVMVWFVAAGVVVAGGLVHRRRFL